MKVAFRTEPWFLVSKCRSEVSVGFSFLFQCAFTIKADLFLKVMSENMHIVVLKNKQKGITESYVCLSTYMYMQLYELCYMHIKYIKIQNHSKKSVYTGISEKCGILASSLILFPDLDILYSWIQCVMSGKGQDRFHNTGHCILSVTMVPWAS